MRDADGLSCESIKEDLKTECEEAKASARLGFDLRKGVLKRTLQGLVD